MAKNATEKIVLEDPEMFPDLVSLAPPSAEMQASADSLHEVGPGIWVGNMPALEVPSHVLCRLVPVGDGTYTLQPEPYPGLVRMTDDIGKRLGILGLSATTMRRLLWAGYVDHSRAGPGCLFISIESLLEHFRRTANDCESEESFWTAERRERWRVTCEAVSNLTKIEA